MIEDNSPLMFINSVSTTTGKNSNQETYDSRHPKVKNVFKPMNALEEKKLDNIIQMYKKGRPVLCDIVCEDEELTGIPFSKNEDVLDVYISENKSLQINLKKISKLVIVKF